MNGTLGRDRVWNEHIWGEIDKAVREEVGRIRVAQKVFPTTVVNNVLPVLVDTVVSPKLPATKPAVLQTEDDEFRPFIEMSIEFVLTQAQVDGEENMRLAPALARRAASEIAAAEDTILFLGNSTVSKSPPYFTETGVVVTNRSQIPVGFVDAAGPSKVKVDKSSATSVGDIIGAVASGIADLNKRGQPGPYALFLPTKRFAQTFSPATAGALETPGDAINHVLTGGFYMVTSLDDKDVGILVSLGGEPVRITLGIDATVAFTFTDTCGYHFRAFERMQFVIRDDRAFETLTFS